MMWISVYQRKSAVKVFDFLRASASPWWILVFGCCYVVSVEFSDKVVLSVLIRVDQRQKKTFGS
jgi:hypothetical protein